MLAPAGEPVGAEHGACQHQPELRKDRGNRQPRAAPALPPAGARHEQQRRYSQCRHQAVIVSVAGELPEHQRIEPDQSNHQARVSSDLFRHQSAQRCRDHKEHRRHNLLPEQVRAQSVPHERDRCSADRIGNRSVAARVVLEHSHFSRYRVVDLRRRRIERDRQFAVQPKCPHVSREVNRIWRRQRDRGKKREAAEYGRHNRRRVAVPKPFAQRPQAEQVEHGRYGDDEANLHHVGNLSPEHLRNAGETHDFDVHRP